MCFQQIDIGSVPSDEMCAQLGWDEYPRLSRIECYVYRAQLLRLFPVPKNARARIAIKTFPYEQDSYREVCVKFDDTCREAVEYAYRVEANAPLKWDPAALQELHDFGYYDKTPAKCYAESLHALHELTDYGCL